MSKQLFIKPFSLYLITTRVPKLRNKIGHWLDWKEGLLKNCSFIGSLLDDLQYLMKTPPQGKSKRSVSFKACIPPMKGFWWRELSVMTGKHWHSLIVNFTITRERQDVHWVFCRVRYAAHSLPECLAQGCVWRNPGGNGPSFPTEQY